MVCFIVEVLAAEPSCSYIPAADDICLSLNMDVGMKNEGADGSC